jgi:predicted ester cyclase
MPDGERVSFSVMEIVQVREGRIAWRRAMLDVKGAQLKQRLQAMQVPA